MGNKMPDPILKALKLMESGIIFLKKNQKIKLAYRSPHNLMVIKEALLPIYYAQLS